MVIDQRLPKQRRILNSSDYKRRRSFRLHSTSFTIVYEPHTISRLGLVVSRKVGDAVQRNRIKRLLREWFRRSKDQIPAFDLIVIAKPSIDCQISFENVCKEMDVVYQLNLQK